MLEIAKINSDSTMEREFRMRIRQNPKLIQYAHGGYLFILYETGLTTQIKLDEKCDKTCGHGECFWALASETCVCYTDYTGPNCETRLLHCNVNGTKSFNNTQCRCKRFFFGKYCQHQLENFNNTECSNRRSIRTSKMVWLNDSMAPLYRENYVYFFAHINMVYIISQVFVCYKRGTIIYYSDLNMNVEGAIQDERRKCVIVLEIIDSFSLAKASCISYNGIKKHTTNALAHSKFISFFIRSSLVYLVSSFQRNSNGKIRKQITLSYFETDIFRIKFIKKLNEEFI